MGPSSAPSCRRVEESIWAKAFYGCSNSPLGKSHIQELRTATVKSLRRNRAGANPVLALSLQDSMASDPGFYQLWTVLSTFRRVIRKQPHLVDMWSFLMNRFTGDRSIGPFGKLLEVAEQVGWCVEVPGFYDHDGCWISLLDTTEGILRGVAEEACSQFVAKEISKRKDFEDLRGIDLAVFRQSQRRLDGKTRAFLQPIQDGSFLDSKAQSKFDMAKERMWSGRHS